MSEQVGISPDTKEGNRKETSYKNSHKAGVISGENSAQTVKYQS